MKQRAFFIFGLLLTIVVLTYLFTQVTLSEVLELISNANRQILIVFFCLSICTSLIRTWRYHFLLRLSGHSVPGLPLFLVVLVRNVCADLLPARLGDLIYILLATNRLAVPAQAVTAGFAMAFVFDILAIAPLLLLGVLFVAVPEGLPTLQLLMVGGAFLAAGLLVAIRLAWIFKTCSVWLDRSPIWRGASAVIARFLRQTASEIDKLGSKEAYLKVLFLSLLVRLSKYSSLYVLLLALLLPRGYTPASLPAPEIFLVLFSAELAATLPFAGFAAIGAYQGAWIMAFSLLGFPLHLAQVTSLAHHIFTQVYGYTLGLIALLLLSLPAFQPIQTRPAE